jgi:hypothetical protein
MRPSAAGPVLAPETRSSVRASVFWCCTAPTETMFLAQACGRDEVVPMFDCDWQMSRSVRRMMSSIWLESVVYAVVRAPPQLLLWNTAL